MLVALTVAGTAATAATACHTASRAPAHPAPPSGTLTTPDARALVEDYEGRLAAAYAAGAWRRRGGDVVELVRFRLDDLTAVSAAIARFLARRSDKRRAGAAP